MARDAHPAPFTQAQRAQRRWEWPLDCCSPESGFTCSQSTVCWAPPPSPWGMCVCAFSQGISPETPCSLQSEPSHDLHLALHPEPVALPRTAPAQGSLLAPSPRARASPLHGWLMSNSTCPGLGSSPFPCGKVSIC